MKIGIVLGLVLLSVVSLGGCTSDPRLLPPSADIPATVAAAVAATVAPTPTAEPATSPTPTSTPWSIPSPTFIPSPSSSPTFTPAPTAADTPTPLPTSTLIPTATPTPRPMLVPVNTPGYMSQTITTSLGQQVDIVVEGFVDSPLRFSQLVQSLNEIEKLLGKPYPSPRVTLTRADRLQGGFCGHNQMSYAPRYSGEPYVLDDSIIRLRVNSECDDTFASIAHEVAHTWFHGSDPADWIDEGLANAFEQQLLAIHSSEEILYPPVTYCADYRNIAELEQGRPKRLVSGDFTGFDCNYHLGNGLFGALRGHYGDEEFNRRAAALARPPISVSKRAHTISTLRETFGGDEEALVLVNLWYDGQPEMRKYWHLDAVEWSFPPTIAGEHLYFSGKTIEPEMVHDFVPGDDTYCSQFSLFQGMGGQNWVASVSGPLPVGWQYEEAKLIVTNSDINPATGEFRVSAKIIDKAVEDFDDLSLSVRSRVTSGADGLCQESVHYSQISLTYGSLPEEAKAVKYYHQGAIEWTFPPTIDGGYLYFDGKTNDPEMVHDFLQGDDPYCSQFSLYEGAINQKWVASVASPLPAGWYHYSIPKLVVIDHDIDSATGRFRITARVNDQGLLQSDDLSLAVTSRVITGADGLCPKSTTYSQLPVVTGTIPVEFKEARHYSLDAIDWLNPPAVSGNTMRFVGRALPGVIRLNWREGHCSQFLFYERDERGYQYIDNLSLMLPENRQWTSDIAAEITAQRISSDGTFEALVAIRDNALTLYENLTLLVTTEAALERVTNKCGDSDVLSAVDIR